MCKKADIDIIFEWAKKQIFRNHWLPEVNDFYRVFLGEFYWSPAFDYSDYNTWTNEERQIPGQLLITAERYVCESSSYDCSIDDTISIYLPNKLIVDKMNLRWDGSDGRVIDDKGSLIAFDPSVRAPGPGALLVNQDIFLRFLDENKYDINWTVIGEKIIIGDRISADGWIGRLEISGVYRMHGTEVEGVINTSFLP